MPRREELWLHLITSSTVWSLISYFSLCIQRNDFHPQFQFSSTCALLLQELHIKLATKDPLNLSGAQCAWLMLPNEQACPCRGLIEFVFRGACCFYSENVGTAFVAVGLFGVLSVCIHAAVRCWCWVLAAPVETVNWSSFEQLNFVGHAAVPRFNTHQIWYPSCTFLMTAGLLLSAEPGMPRSAMPAFDIPNVIV